MKKLLLISIVLVASLGLSGCGAATDPDIDKMVSITCEMFGGNGETMAANFDMKQMEEIGKLGEKIEKKYEGKEEEFGKIMEASYLKQCPDAYKKMKKFEDMDN